MKYWLLFFSFWFSGPVFTADFEETSPRVIVHLLDYIAMDYPGAVADEKVLNQFEYEEQVDFVDTAIRMSQTLEELKGKPEIEQGLSKLRSLIEAKRDSETIAKQCREVEGFVLKLTGLSVAPLHWPNIKEAKASYDRNCANCHGVTGQGDGPSGTNLDPKPANFLDEKMGDMPPFQLFNAIRLGLPGTAMMAFSNLSDEEIWGLAFYLSSLRHNLNTSSAEAPQGVTLTDVATLSDNALVARYQPRDARAFLAQVRLYVPPRLQGDASLEVAKTRLGEALTALKNGKRDEAKQKAIVAYLEGLEPVEPRIRARDSDFVITLEQKMADVRSAIDAGHPVEMVETRIHAAVASLEQAQALLSRQEGSSTFTFSVAAGIFLREAFEAALILITLLGVIRAVGSKKAALFVHGGWVAAVIVGVVAWFFSGWLMQMSGAQREMLEGSIALFAVVVLLYFGFWLHRRTEIGRWRAFLSEMVQSAVEGKRLVALGLVAFMAVFREAFETVLFLRALLLEAGPNQELPMLLGVLTSFLVVVVLSALIVRYSVKIPIRQLFGISSVVMVLLSLILIGNAMHSFQETGLVSITAIPLNLRWDLIGLYPTYETILPQLLIVGISLAVWCAGRCWQTVTPGLEKEKA